MAWYWIVLISVVGGYFLINVISGLILCFIAVLRKESPKKIEDHSDASALGLEDPETYSVIYEEYHKSGEEITHKMRDGYTMYARIYKKQGADKTIVFCHGFKGFPELNYYNTFDWLRHENVNMVFLTMRSHDKSEGKFIKMGYAEKDDLHEWVETIYSILNTPIYLWGTSMGCATTLFSLEKPYDNYVKGIVADCGYYNLYYEYYTCFRSYCGAFLARVVMEFFAFWMLVIPHINIRKLKTTDVINNTNIPILFVHGADDKFVLPDNTMKNYNVYKGPKDLLIVNKAPHARNMYFGKEEYILKAKKLLGLN